MKLRTVRFISYLCLAALLLAGCSKQETGPGEMGSKVWEEMPALTYGVLESDPLGVLSWNSGRCEATAKYEMAETENGYYLKLSGYLYYADKKDLKKWVVLCSQPECNHMDIGDCSARFDSRGFVVDENRIYFTEDSFCYPHLYTGRGQGTVLLQMAADGTDMELAYVIEDAMMTGVGSGSNILTPEHWLSLTLSMDKEGNTDIRFFRVTNTGLHMIPLDTVSNVQSTPVLITAGAYGLNGDEAFFCNVLSNTGMSYYRFINNKLEEVNLQGLDLTGSYLSGNTLRVFRPNDGYYDIDLTTREEVFLTPARLENSMGYIFLPNCIIESTLFMDEGRKEDITHSMEMFDGEKWRAVKLPLNLVNAGVSESLFVRGITSDGVILTLENNALDDYITPVYRIALDSEELVMEYYGEIVEPHDEEIE